MPIMVCMFALADEDKENGTAGGGGEEFSQMGIF